MNVKSFASQVLSLWVTSLRDYQDPRLRELESRAARSLSHVLFLGVDCAI